MATFATVAACTLGFRALTVPLVLAQARAVRAVSAGPNAAIAAHLNRLLAVEWNKTKDAAQRRRALGLALKGYLALLRGHKAAIVLPPLTNIAALSSYVAVVRASMRSDPALWVAGGPFFAADLTAPDPTLAMPACFVALTYMVFDVGQNRPPVGAVDRFRQGMQTLALFSAPLAVFTPAGYFAYLIPSAAFSLAQAHALRRWRASSSSLSSL